MAAAAKANLRNSKRRSAAEDQMAIWCATGYIDGCAASGFPRRLGQTIIEAQEVMSRKQIENTIPVLAVRNLDQSIGFYQRVLGFEVEWNAGHICSVGRDGSSIMLRDEEKVMPITVWIGIVDDSMFEEIQHSDAVIIQAPSNKPWAYEMKVADPDGNILWLGAEPRK